MNRLLLLFEPLRPPEIDRFCCPLNALVKIHLAEFVVLWKQFLAAFHGSLFSERQMVARRSGAPRLQRPVCSFLKADLEPIFRSLSFSGSKCAEIAHFTHAALGLDLRLIGDSRPLVVCTLRLPIEDYRVTGPPGVGPLTHPFDMAQGLRPLRGPPSQRRCERIDVGRVRLCRLMCGKPAAFRQAAQAQLFSLGPAVRRGGALPHVRRPSRDFFHSF